MPGAAPPQRDGAPTPMVTRSKAADGDKSGCEAELNYEGTRVRTISHELHRGGREAGWGKGHPSPWATFVLHPPREEPSRLNPALDNDIPFTPPWLAPQLCNHLLFWIFLDNQSSLLLLNPAWVKSNFRVPILKNWYGRKS